MSMSPLATALVEIFDSGCQPPLRADSFPSILRATSYSLDRVEVVEVEAALTELMSVGRVERIWRRGRAYYQAAANRPPISDDLKVTRRGLK